MPGQNDSTSIGASGRPGGRRGARSRLAALLGLAAASLLAVSGVALADRGAFIGPFNTVTTLTSTVPANGDVNPYGIVVVPRSVGQLVAGQLLISNFNNSANAQGTGTTIDEISPATANLPAGTAHVFATIDPAQLPGPCPGGVGLTTALAALPSGYVIVGSLPTSDGMSDTAQAGCLLVLNSTGHVVETIAGGPIDGPWDMTAVTHGPITTLFVSNVLNNIGAIAAPNGTVVRLRLFSFPGHAPRLFDADVIGTGFPTRTDPGALVIGPTGVALSERDTLYVADTLGNRIAAIPDAMDRRTPLPNGGLTVTSGGSLNGPLGLTIAPNDDILTANASDGNIVETTPDGKQLVAKTADATTGAGSLFGLTIAPGTNGVFYVDDGDNTLRLLH
jgi:hypothetical protein